MTYKIALKRGELLVSDELYKDVRKKPVLSLLDGNTVVKLASFNNEEAMMKFLECFGDIPTEGGENEL